MAATRWCQARIPIEQVLELGTEIADALDAAHANPRRLI
jgi:hypothetical protein